MATTIETGSASQPEHRTLAENIHSNSLYEDSDEDFRAATPDIAMAIASQRFFFSSPGHSNSIIESSSSSSRASSSSSRPETESVSGCGVAVPTYSPDPYVDFRRSMQEMVDASEIHDVGESCDYLHELLMCYLSLNPKSNHKFILRAFADLLVSLMDSPPQLHAGKHSATPSSSPKSPS